MGFVARLRRGTHIINLNASPFTVTADFVPPTVAETPRIAENGSRRARRARRARRTGETQSTQNLSVPVHTQGTSTGYIRGQVDNINAFLKDAGKYDNPTYLEWRPDNYMAAEPVWGQFGAYSSMEVLWGEMEYGKQYGWWDHSRLIPDCNINLVVGPMIEGKRQLVATATGGIVEDWIGATDGRSRGIIIPRGDATNGNKIINPIFGHGTWSNGWTAAAAIVASKNVDLNFIVYGLNSAMISSTHDTVNNYFTRTINVGNTNTHVLSCYAKLPDSSAISATQCQLYYNTAVLTTTYTSVGNGWYRLSASLTGANTNRVFGIEVNSKYTIYIDAWLLEEISILTSFFYGDMLGCHWDGTSHDSISHRDAASINIPTANIITRDRGAIRCIWKADNSNTDYASAAGYLFTDNGLLIANYFNGQWSFGGIVFDDTFSPNDKRVFYLVWSSTNVEVYMNGVSKGTAVYTTPTIGATFYIGSTTGMASQIGGAFQGLNIYHYSPSAAEILADYNNIAPLVADGKCIDPIPYIWTKDGDNVVDCYDDTATYRNIAIIGGVAGDAPAKTEFKATTDGLNDADIYIGLLDVEYRKYLDPEFLHYIPASPPDVIDMTNVDITIATIPIDDDEFEILSGKSFGIMLSANDTVNNVIIKTGVNPGGAYYYSKQLATTWLVGSLSNDMTPDAFIMPNEQLYRELGITRALSVNAVGKRLAAGATHFHLYSAQIVPYPLVRFINTSASGIEVAVLYLDGKAYEVNASAMSYTMTVRGDKIELVPGRYNWLISYIGKEGVAVDSADTMTYNAIYVTPRWTVL